VPQQGDGSWFPVVSHDSAWGFDGRSRVRTQPLSWPRWLLAGGAAWLLVLAAAETATAITALQANGVLDRSSAAVLLGAGCLAVLATVLWGGVLGRAGRWRQLGMSAVAASATVLVGYAVIMIAAAPATDSSVDNETGAGFAILAVPTFLVVATLLALGALAARLPALVRRRHPTRAASITNGG
jgi:hypothetical protein